MLLQIKIRKLFFLIGLHDGNKDQKEENPEIVKEELSNLLRGTDTVEEQDFNVLNGSRKSF